MKYELLQNWMRTIAAILILTETPMSSKLRRGYPRVFVLPAVAVPMAGKMKPAAVVKSKDSFLFDKGTSSLPRLAVFY